MGRNSRGARALPCVTLLPRGRLERRGGGEGNGRESQHARLQLCETPFHCVQLMRRLVGVEFWASAADRASALALPETAEPRAELFEKEADNFYAEPMQQVFEIRIPLFGSCGYMCSTCLCIFWGARTSFKIHT